MQVQSQGIASMHLCGSLGASIVKYTSYWHFQNHTQGPDEHGNDFGGYNYDKLTVWGTIDTMAASWLYGDYLDDGAGE